MEIQYHWDIIQGSDEWLNVRIGIITASQMSQLITPTGKLADNKDSRAIVCKKVYERLTKESADGEFDSYHMERGRVFEPFARDLYSREREQVIECGFITRQFDGFKIGYSPDGIVGDEGLIEIKCPDGHKHVKEICENEEPKDAMMQMQTGLLVTGRKWCDFISHCNGMHQRIVRVYPNLELHELIKSASKNLEECININLDRYAENTKYMPKAKFERGI